MPLARTLRRIDVTSDRTIIGSDSDRTIIGSDSDWPANPFEFEPEYNGDQAIDNRMPPSCPRRRALATLGPRPPYPRLAQAPPMRAYFLRR